VIVAPVFYLIFAAHSYRALSSRNPTVTLAAHWYTMGLLLLLLGPGLLGGLQAAPGIRQWTAGTRLSDLQTTLTALAVVAIVLGVINQAAAEVRGQNRRVTGLAPFWLVSFGVIGGGAALAGAGIAQTYLERILGMGYLETQTLIVPLYALWVLGWLSVALGTGIYALAFWARRPVDTSQ
jgi:nitric oxide reductase subunit B